MDHCVVIKINGFKGGVHLRGTRSYAKQCLVETSPESAMKTTVPIPLRWKIAVKFPAGGGGLSCLLLRSELK